MLTQRDARVNELLPEIKVPSLVVVGAEDARSSQLTTTWAAKFRRAKKVVIPAAGTPSTSTAAGLYRRRVGRS